MAHRALKPYNLLLYLLVTIAFFFLGLVYAKIIEAGKGQMLAAGAIILGYGIIGAVIGLVLSLILAFKVQRSVIIMCNVLSVLIIAASVLYFTISYKNRQQEKQNEQSFQKRQVAKTKPRLFL